MKIGIDARTLLDMRYSGVPEYTHQLISEILKIDKVNQYSLFYNSYKKLDNQVPFFDQPNIKVIKSNYPNKIFNYLFLKLFRLPKIDKKLGVDLFFMPHINFIALLNYKNSIITIHDLSFIRYPEYFSIRKNFWHSMVNVRKLIKTFDKIIVFSENTQRDIVGLFGKDACKINVINSGISDKFRVIDRNDNKFIEIKNKYCLPNKFILFLGTIEPRKNINTLIKSYERLRINSVDMDAYKLVIVGGNGWKKNSIYQTWRSSKFKNDIFFLGYIPDEDKAYIYNLAHIFVYPSFYEGFGFPPLESMACGTPVITSYSSSLPEIIKNNALMVNPYDIAEISDSMEILIKEKELYMKFSKRGIKNVLQYKWHVLASKYISIFNEYDINGNVSTS